MDEVEERARGKRNNEIRSTLKEIKEKTINEKEKKTKRKQDRTA